MHSVPKTYGECILSRDIIQQSIQPTVSKESPWAGCQESFVFANPMQIIYNRHRNRYIWDLCCDKIYLIDRMYVESVWGGLFGSHFPNTRIISNKYFNVTSKCYHFYNCSHPSITVQNRAGTCRNVKHAGTCRHLQNMRVRAETCRSIQKRA